MRKIRFGDTVIGDLNAVYGLEFDYEIRNGDHKYKVTRLYGNGADMLGKSISGWVLIKELRWLEEHQVWVIEFCDNRV